MNDVPPGFPRFRARPPWWGGDLQTLRNSLVGGRRGGAPPAPAGSAERLWLDLADGTGDALAGWLERPAAPRPGAPWLVLIHGLGGDETSAYIQTSAAHWLARGHGVLRLNLRGAGPSRERCRFQYHAGRTEDLAAALAALVEHLGAAADVGVVPVVPVDVPVVPFEVVSVMVMEVVVGVGADASTVSCPVEPPQARHIPRSTLRSLIIAPV